MKINSFYICIPYIISYNIIVHARRYNGVKNSHHGVASNSRRSVFHSPAVGFINRRFDNINSEVMDQLNMRLDSGQHPIRGGDRKVSTNTRRRQGDGHAPNNQDFRHRRHRQHQSQRRPGNQHRGYDSHRHVRQQSGGEKSISERHPGNQMQPNANELTTLMTIANVQQPQSNSDNAFHNNITYLSEIYSNYNDSSVLSKFLKDKGNSSVLSWILQSVYNYISTSNHDNSSSLNSNDTDNLNLDNTDIFAQLTQNDTHYPRNVFQSFILNALTDIKNKSSNAEDMNNSSSSLLKRLLNYVRLSNTKHTVSNSSHYQSGYFASDKANLHVNMEAPGTISPTNTKANAQTDTRRDKSRFSMKELDNSHLSFGVELQVISDAIIRGWHRRNRKKYERLRSLG